MSAYFEKKTMDENHVIIGVKRLDRLLSGIFQSNPSMAYKRVPRAHSLGKVKVQSSNNGETSMPMVEPTDTEASMGSKPIFTRQISRSTNFLSDAERNQKNIVYNWSGLREIAREAQIIRPNNVNQLIQVVQTAPSKISVMGTGLSFEKLMSTQLDDPDAKLISMDYFCGLVEMRKETAVFGASTPVNDVISILATYNRMLPCSPGVIGIQTLAGAIATGTHGQGTRQSSYSDIVISLQVVLPDGNVVTVNEHTDDYPLQAFVTAMGMLGIVTQIEVAHVPRRIFTCHKFTYKIDLMLSEYEKWNDEHEFVKVWWFPETDFCHVWFVDAANEEECQRFLATPQDALLESEYINRSINDTVNEYLQSMEHDTKATKESSQPQFETLRRFANAKDVIGYLEQIVCKGIPVPQINCEIAIPLEHTRQATLAIKEWASNNKKRLHYPFICRAIGQSKAWLSPAYKGPVCYIGFLVYVAEDGSVRNDGMMTMRDIQTILAPFGGMPHWGKHFQSDIYDFSKLLPKWKDFLALRARIDPKGKMLSPFLQDIFLANVA